MSFVFFFNDTATTEIYTLSLHDALPISHGVFRPRGARSSDGAVSSPARRRSEEHTSELQSRSDLVCRLLLEKKKSPSFDHLPRYSCNTTLSSITTTLAYYFTVPTVRDS